MIFSFTTPHQLNEFKPFQTNVSISEVVFTSPTAANATVITGSPKQFTCRTSEDPPPNPPVIDNFNTLTDYQMIENSTERLTCRSTGGNPLASLAWSCYNGTESNPNINGSSVSRSVQFTARRNQDNTCTCTATHEAGPLQQATMDVYKDCATAAMDELKATGRPTEPVQPCSTNFQHVHNAFNFAQNLCLPHPSRQIGPMYFVTPRKVHCFGFRGNALPIKYKFLKVQDGGGIHGPDAVILLLDYPLTEFVHGKRVTTLHVDNCSGPNKNRYVLAYFCWRTIIGLNEIHYLMQVADPPSTPEFKVDGTPVGVAISIIKDSSQTVTCHSFGNPYPSTNDFTWTKGSAVLDRRNQNSGRRQLQMYRYKNDDTFGYQQTSSYNRGNM
ncbi:hypothetical protein MAR_021110 [Mya arenaria]|uniref:Ig-like domain-containing protein n=1 Tax=Mya arenaria TaxID=6604 RepID=A0ABY7EF03_MYAAR|nr:hypothetical protein MAR_021110 [Mya arenaria]